MALDKELIKSKLTVFVQATDVATFDPDSAYAIAIAQTYTLDESGDTSEVIDLADCDSDWSNPEVVKKSWTLSCDSLLLRDNTASGTIDIGDKYDPYASQLGVGDITWLAVGDASCGGPYDISTGSISTLKYRYGKAVVTSVSQSGNTDDFHTLSVSFSGKGELLWST